MEVRIDILSNTFDTKNTIRTVSSRLEWAFINLHLNTPPWRGLIPDFHVPFLF